MIPLTLLEKQNIHSRLQAYLVLEAQKRGYYVTQGEAWRPDVVAAYYASIGKGIKNSVHCLRLAKDFNLFRDGKFLTEVEDYREMGEWWKAQTTDQYECCWGGDFKNEKGEPNPDSDHFSISHNDVK